MPAIRPEVALRPYGAGDAGLLRAVLGDPEAMRHLGGPESDEALAARHKRYLTSDPRANGLYTIVLAKDDGPVGWIGFWESQWAGETVWECGWHVLPEMQGRGIATSAGRLLLREARSRTRHRFVDAFPSVDNAASNAVCRSLGFSAMGEADVEYPKGHTMRSMHWRFDLERDA